MIWEPYFFALTFDGLADRLDPKSCNEKGKHPPEFHEKINNSVIFNGAWETIRFLNTFEMKPHINVSIHIPPIMVFVENATKPSDSIGYAEMEVSML